MPKTKKRFEKKREAKIARAHATELPQLEEKETSSRRSPGRNAPARGIARYPWAISIIVLLIAIGFVSMYITHAWLFAPRTSSMPSTPTAQATMKPQNASSPCTASSIVKSVTNTDPAPSTTVFNQTVHSYNSAPAMTVDLNKTYCVGINTNRGLILVELDPKVAPMTVNNFVFFAQHHFYDGLKFHRVIPNTSQNSGNIHIIQTGSPTGQGDGGPGYKFNDEPVEGSYVAGTVAMANSGANTNGSQFFINTTDNTRLPKSYNLFGRVVQGLDVAQKIQGPGDDAASKNLMPDVMNYVIVVPAS